MPVPIGVHPCLQVMTLLRDAKKPVVGYNCFDDNIYILTNFGSLPKTWPQFQNVLQEYFPEGVYDTKHMCIYNSRGRTAWSLPFKCPAP
jgi:hypothetical protein